MEPSDSPVVKGQNAAFVKQAFAAIAPRYVLANHVISMGVDVLWRRTTARAVALQKPGIVLDLATGTGDLAAAIQAELPDAAVLGVDFSLPMLRVAKQNGLQNLIVGDAMALPIADASVDVVTVAFGLRNMASWEGAALEMARVLRPGGTLLVLDFSLPPKPVRWAYLVYLRRIMPRVAGLLTGERAAYEYLCSSIERFPSGVEMCSLLCSNGFREAEARPLSFGIASLYLAQK